MLQVNGRQHNVSIMAAALTCVAGRGMRRASFSRVLRRSRMKGWFLMRNTPVSIPASNSPQDPLILAHDCSFGKYFVKRAD